MKTIPVAFIPNGNTELYVMDKKVAIFCVEHAKIVFQYFIPELQVWGIKNGKAMLLASMFDAQEFFCN